MVYFLNGANGSCMEVLQADGGAVKYVMYFDNDGGGGSDVIVVVTENMVIGQFSVDPSDGSLVEVTKIKVSRPLFQPLLFSPHFATKKPSRIYLTV